MPAYIGNCFITSFSFLWDIGKMLNIDKYNVLIYKDNIITDFLKTKYKLNDLNIIYKKNSTKIFIFDKIQIADPYYILNLEEKTYISENFIKMKNDIDENENINFIIYSI